MPHKAGLILSILSRYDEPISEDIILKQGDTFLSEGSLRERIHKLVHWRLVSEKRVKKRGKKGKESHEVTFIYKITNKGRVVLRNSMEKLRLE